jgi:hypothetical protein
LIPAGLVILVVQGATEIGPAHEAASGHGIVGYWVAQVEVTCDHQPCKWKGDFVLPNGQVRRTYVDYDGKYGMTLHPGSRLPAIDTGGPNEVFPRNESQSTWILDLLFLIAGAVALPVWFWRVPYRWLRSRIRGPDPLVPSI